MQTAKDFLLRQIEARARHRASELASELVVARPGDKELILAEMEMQRWLADRCSECENYTETLL